MPSNAHLSHYAKDFDFLYKKEEIVKCLQCGRCTSSCPAARVFPEYSPREIMKRFESGEEDSLIDEGLIWLCGQCYTCTSRCPRNNDPASIILDLRKLAYKEGRARGDVYKNATTMLNSLWERGVTLSPDLISDGMLDDLIDVDSLKKLRADLGMVPSESREVKMPDKALEEIRKILKLTMYVDDEV